MDGLGFGIIINGKIYRGDNNLLGEFGYIKVVIDGKKCKCGVKGCLEVYVFMNFLIESYNEEVLENILDIDEFEKLYM